jgi:hypothetical protein
MMKCGVFDDESAEASGKAGCILLRHVSQRFCLEERFGDRGLVGWSRVLPVQIDHGFHRCHRAPPLPGGIMAGSVSVE